MQFSDYFSVDLFSDEAEALAHGGDRLRILGAVVSIIETFLEVSALIIIILASIRALQRLLNRYFKHRQLIDYREIIRLEFGLSLALALEFLLAADIAATAVAPTWEALGKLAVVAAIRTFLNFFLEQEVEKLEEKSHRTKYLLRQIKEFGKSTPKEVWRSPLHPETSQNDLGSVESDLDLF